MFQSSLSQASASASTSTFITHSSNHQLPSLLLNSRTRSRSPVSNFQGAPAMDPQVPISPPSTPPTSPTPSNAALSASPPSPSSSSSQQISQCIPNVNVMVRSSGGRLIDHNSGSASDPDSSNLVTAESSSEISAEGSVGGGIAGHSAGGYGKEEDWKQYLLPAGLKGKGKEKGKEQCAVDLLSATASKMSVSPSRAVSQTSESPSYQPTASSPKEASIASDAASVNGHQQGVEEDDSFSEDDGFGSSNQFSQHQLTFSRPISMPDTPAATPESFQYHSSSRGSSSTSTSSSSYLSGPELGVSHRPSFSARAFLVELFPDLESKLLSARSAVNCKSKKNSKRSLQEGWLAEDAGVELIENCYGWRGAVLDRNGAVLRRAGRGAPEKRVLYVSMPLGNKNRASAGQEPTSVSHISSNVNKNSALNASSTVHQSPASLRTTVLSLLDFASDSLHPPCGALVLSIEKDVLAQGELPSLLHGLCYVGGNVVSFNGEKEESAEEGGAGEKPKEGVVLVRIEL